MRNGTRRVVVEVALVDCIPGSPLSPATPEQIALEVAMHAISDRLYRSEVSS